MLIGLLIVSDIRLYREGLAQMLGREEGLRVVGTAADHQDAIRAMRELRPEVVLVDQAMPEALAFMRAVRDVPLAPAIVALGVSEVDTEVVAWAEAGIAGYVSREAGVPELIATVRGVGRGELLCSPRIAAALLRRVSALSYIRGGPMAPSRLTARETEVLSLLERGFGNKEIARQLGIEVATVKNHVHNILEKLRVRRRGEAAAHLRRAFFPAPGPEAEAARPQTI